MIISLYFMFYVLCFRLKTLESVHKSSSTFSCRLHDLGIVRPEILKYIFPFFLLFLFVFFLFYLFFFLFSSIILLLPYLSIFLWFFFLFSNINFHNYSVLIFVELIAASASEDLKSNKEVLFNLKEVCTFVLNNKNFFIFVTTINDKFVLLFFNLF